MKLKSNQILWNISDIPINVSGTNTGDETTATIKTKLGITTLSGDNTGDQTISLTGDITGSGTGSFATTLANITDSGVGTFKKITTNTKGLVTGTATVAQSDITGLLGAGSISNTMLANSAVANLSGTNSGDQTTISGNAGTATTLATARNINGVSFNGSADITINAVDSTDRVASSLVGAANGVAPLGSDSRISSTYLPSYVDDILEYTDLAGFPVTGETGKIYIALDTNRPYRWSGSIYVVITGGSGAVDSVAGRTGVVTLTSTDVGLANVNNTSDANKPISTATQTALNLKAPLASPSFTSNVTLYDSTSTSSLKVSPGYKGTTATDAWVTLDPNGPGGSSGLYVWDSLVCSGPLYSGENKLATENFVTSLGYTTGSGYAPLLNPTFTGTVSGITSAMVGLGNVANTAQVTSVSGTAPIVSSGGLTPVISISEATTSLAGSMSAADKLKLDNLFLGWNSIPTCTYETADSPTFQFSIASDMTQILGLGNRIKLTQTTDKYFIITAIGAFTAGKTIITVYGGTDYTLTNTAITSPLYSNIKSPFGFPLNPTKWTSVFEDTAGSTWVTGANVINTWYYLLFGGVAAGLNIPIGLWNVSYTIPYYLTNAATIYGMVTLTNTNTQLNKYYTSALYLASNTGAITSLHKSGIVISQSVKTLWYFMVMSPVAGSTMSALAARGAFEIRAVCAYL